MRGSPTEAKPRAGSETISRGSEPKHGFRESQMCGLTPSDGQAQKRVLREAERVYGSLAPVLTKWVYFILFAITALATWMLRDYSSKALSHVSVLKSCLGDGAAEDGTCVGKGAVLRISLGNVMFFAIMFLLTLGVTRKDSWRRFLHTGLWPIKIVLWAVLIGITFAFPNHALYIYGQAARVLSGFFLVLQVLIMIDFIYLINMWLLERDHCLPGLVIGTLVTFIGSLGVTGVLYYFYAPSVHCHLNIFFITITLILGIGYSILSVTPIRAANAGLLTSGCVLGYCVYLTWSALTSETVDRVCVHNGGTGSRGVKIVGFVLAVLAILAATFTSATTTIFETKAPEAQKEGEEEDSELLPGRPDVFYIVFLLGSAYMAMLFTGWSLNNTPGQFTIDYGWFSVWVKMASSWFSALLYVWTLIAPAILRNRNFS
ncbi:hypothetical protein WJX74_006470 [Apatococcus lobatus]|uniref:Serine incorporator n=1 Tax=Apatococcus lobatus TaxID=904363 RepID=A0AAW1S2M7_9CHLO